MYKDFLRKGILRVLPDALLIRVLNKKGPQQVCTYLDRETGEVKGYGVGIFASYENLDKKVFIKRLLQAVEKLSSQGISKLCLEDINLLKEEELDYLEKESELKICDGKEISSDLIPHIINKICKYQSKEIKEQEILIIGDYTEITRKIALELSKDLRFLTLEGNHEFNHVLAMEIFNKTGLSVHLTQSANKALSHYDFIINLRKDIEISSHSFKKRTIIFDFGKGRRLSKSIRKDRKDIMMIDNLIFNRTDKIISEPLGFQFDEEIESQLYHIMMGELIKDFIKIKIGSHRYSIKKALKIYFNDGKTCRNFVTNVNK